MLRSSTDDYRRRQRLTAAAVVQARKTDAAGIVRLMPRYQTAAVALALQATEDQLSEIGLAAAAVAQVDPISLLTPPRALLTMLKRAESQAAVDRLVQTMVSDAGRTAQSVDFARRPKVAGYVRFVNPPCCSRCAVLAGRVYRHSQGFQRHPLCDCGMQPVGDDVPDGMVTDPSELIANGQVAGLSKGDRIALDNGADLGQVANVRRKKAGLTEGSSVLERGGKLTPQGILRATDNRDEQVALLRRYGYLL